jgi:hypothetical protein
MTVFAPIPRGELRTIARQAVSGERRQYTVEPAGPSKRWVRIESSRGHMERRKRPDIDTVREVLQEENERVSEEPAPPEEEQEEQPEESGREDDS